MVNRLIRMPDHRYAISSSCVLEGSGERKMELKQ